MRVVKATAVTLSIGMMFAAGLYTQNDLPGTVTGVDDGAALIDTDIQPPPIPPASVAPPDHQPALERQVRQVSAKGQEPRVRPIEVETVPPHRAERRGSPSKKPAGSNAPPQQRDAAPSDGVSGVSIDGRVIRTTLD